jgi:hypothetical protein
MKTTTAWVNRVRRVLRLGWRGAGRPAVMAGLALAATGCVRIDSTLDLNADGSGKWRLIYSMPPHMIKQAETAAVLAAELRRAGGDTNAVPEPLDLPMLFDEVVIRNRFVPLAEQGIILNRIEVKPRGGWPSVDLKVQFASLEALLKLPFFADCGASFRREADGTARLTLVAPQMGVTEKVPDLTSTDVSMSVAPFLRGMSVVSRIGLPADIRNTNAGLNDGRRATWEWDFDRDTAAMSRLNQAKMIIIFDSAGMRMQPFEKPARAPGP